MPGEVPDAPAPSPEFFDIPEDSVEAYGYGQDERDASLDDVEPPLDPPDADRGVGTESAEYEIEAESSDEPSEVAGSDDEPPDGAEAGALEELSGEPSNEEPPDETEPSDEPSDTPGPHDEPPDGAEAGALEELSGEPSNEEPPDETEPSDEPSDTPGPHDEPPDGAEAGALEELSGEPSNEEPPDETEPSDEPSDTPGPHDEPPDGTEAGALEELSGEPSNEEPPDETEPSDEPPDEPGIDDGPSEGTEQSDEPFDEPDVSEKAAEGTASLGNLTEEKRPSEETRAGTELQVDSQLDDKSRGEAGEAPQEASEPSPGTGGFDDQEVAASERGSEQVDATGMRTDVSIQRPDFNAQTDSPLPLIDGPHESPERWVTDINPARGTELGDHNCGECARAVQETWEGSPVAVGSETPAVHTQKGEYGHVMRDWAGADLESKSLEGVGRNLAELGPGSSAIVECRWELNGEDVGGHYFNAVNDAGTIKAVDGQSGKVGLWPPTQDGVGLNPEYMGPVKAVIFDSQGRVVR